jgi:hypothetical protein
MAKKKRKAKKIVLKTASKKPRRRKARKVARKRKPVSHKKKGRKVMTALQRKYFGKGHGKIAGTSHKRKARKSRKARKTSHRTIHSAGRTQVIVMGKKRRVSHRRKAAGFLMGGSSGSLLKRVGSNTLNVASGVAGGVAGAYLCNMIPVTNKYLKPGIPALAGIVLASWAKLPALKFAGLGLGVIGGLALVRAFVPGIGLLAGDSPLYLPAGNDQMGALSDYTMGQVTDLSGMEGETAGYVTQADM